MIFRIILLASFLSTVMSSLVPDSDFICRVCGEGKVVGKPNNVEFFDQGGKPRTCGWMEEITTLWGANGPIGPATCELWQYYAKLRCECRAPTRKPTLRKSTRKPTQIPTRKPTRKPTKKK